MMAVTASAFMREPRAVNVGYQQYKCGLLKLLALVGLVALIVHVVDRGRWRHALKVNPLVASLLGMALCVVVSTCLSVDWRSSLWGSSEMGQGAMTWAAAFVLLALVATFLRTWEQAWRLVDVLVVVSATVSVHAILQRMGYDPQAFNVNTRAFGVAGNPIYLAGYLLMVVPLALGRLLSLRGLKEAGSGLHRVLVLLCLVVQVAAIIGAASRGPFVGLLAGLGMFAVLVSWVLNWRRVQQVLAVLVGVAVILAMVGLRYAATSQATGLSSAVSVPLLGNDSGRSSFWESAPGLIMGSRALQHPTGGTDSLHRLRAWVGHGLETVPLVLPEHRSGAEGFVIENRFHNGAWDHIFAFGIIGLIAISGVVLSAFGLGYRALGLLHDRVASLIFGVGVVGFAIGSAIVLGWVLGAGFMGLGLVLGLTMGLIAVAAGLACRGPSTMFGAEIEPSALLMAAVLASLAGHVTDMAFVFESAPTFALLFVLLGVMLAMLRGLTTEADAPAAPVAAARKKKFVQPTASRPAVDWRGALASAAFVGSGLVLLTYSLNHAQSFEPLHTTDVLAYSFFNPGGTEGHYSLMLVPVLVFWLAGSWVLATRAGGINRLPHGSSFGRVALISGSVGLIYALINTAQIVAIGPIPRRASPTDLVLAQAHSSSQVLLTFLGMLFVLTLLAGWALGRRGAGHAFGRRTTLAVAGCSVAGALVLCWPVALAPLVVDATAQWGMALESLGRTRLAAAIYASAIEQRPRLFGYRSLLVENLLLEAEAAPNSAEAKVAWQQAERVMIGARDYSDLNRSALYLGRIYTGWALAEEGLARAALAQKAELALNQARVFDPMFEPVLREQSLLHRLVLKDEGGAQTLATKAAEFADDGPLAWAEHYATRAARSADVGLAKELNEVALSYFERVLKVNAERSDLVARAHAGKGKILFSSGRVALAIPFLVAAVKGSLAYERWPLHRLLAQAYAQQNDFIRAREQLDFAIQLAPSEQRAEMQQFRQMLEPK